MEFDKESKRRPGFRDLQFQKVNSTIANNGVRNGKFFILNNKIFDIDFWNISLFANRTHKF